MRIELIISTDTLGCNTGDDNKRYVAVVKEEVQAAYPDAEVSVELLTNVTAGSCWIQGDPAEVDEVMDNVNLIARKVWERGDY